VKLVRIAIAWLASVTLAQAQPTTFEVATVKPSKSIGGINNRHDPVLATWTNMPLAIVIESGYRIQGDQLIGGPDWINSDRWDIVAKTDPPATWEQQNKMLQPLLADRFKLTVHWETRQLPQYELTVAKGGLKVHVHSVNGNPNARPAGTRIGRGLIDAYGIPAAQFASWLRGELGRPVIDNTGLTGNYDFKLQRVPDESQPNSGGVAPPPESTGPSIFAAIQDLGLKLKPIRGPLKVLVIDHVEKPSEN
jgi:uncharacterized protein (TIGR03435 family)